MSEKTGELAFDRIPNAAPDSQQEMTIPLMRIYDEVLLPHTIAPLPLEDDEVINRLVAADVLANDQTILFLNADFAAKDNPSDKPLIGTEAALLDMTDEPEFPTLLMVQGRRRVQFLSMVQEEPIPLARVRLVEETYEDVDEMASLRAAALEDFQDLVDRNDGFDDGVIEYVFTLEDFSEFTDVLAAALPLSLAERQELLNETNLNQRHRRLLEMMQMAIGAMDVRDDVNEQVHDEIARAQREMYLREQMRVIQQELGEFDSYEDELRVLRERILEAQLPEEAQQQALRELSRLNTMSPITPEATVIRTYLDWLLDVPWHKATKDRLNLVSAEKVLNAEHYGLEKVKERVLEHIAVRKMAGSNMRTPILCFVGPPGVGKTSLGKTIAQSLGREFVRMSLGGVRDEAEIRGHRRTYIGALPGRIIQTMKRAGTVNPLFMLDEIDKLSEDYRGDPAAALLEVLDPEQNHEFADHYLEVPYDLSKVLFIATANDLYPLPEALIDRMEIIEFMPYTEEEKLEIAKRFLIPKQLKAHGISRRGIQFQERALQHIIQHYTLEAGVRNLEREIANVCRKITKLAALRKQYPKRVTPNLVTKYLGPPYLIDSHLNRIDSIGLVTGMVWTPSGGDTQIIEAALLPGKGSLTLTGQLGDVLQESAQIALNYTRARADEFDLPHDDFENYDVHIHMPEGAVPKDGPSAGITLATAIISVFTERAVRSDYAMTGEITLRGFVLPVGGIKEKLLAARRRGIKNIILPHENEKDLSDLPKNVVRDLNIHFVKNMQEVLDLLLFPAPELRQRDLDALEAEDDEIDEEIGEESELADNQA